MNRDRGFSSVTLSLQLLLIWVSNPFTLYFCDIVKDYLSRRDQCSIYCKDWQVLHATRIFSKMKKYKTVTKKVSGEHERSLYIFLKTWDTKFWIPFNNFSVSKVSRTQKVYPVWSLHTVGGGDLSFCTHFTPTTMGDKWDSSSFHLESTWPFYTGGVYR